MSYFKQLEIINFDEYIEIIEDIKKKRKNEISPTYINKDTELLNILAGVEPPKLAETYLKLDSISHIEGIMLIVGLQPEIHKNLKHLVVGELGKLSPPAYFHEFCNSYFKYVFDHISGEHENARAFRLDGLSFDSVHRYITDFDSNIDSGIKKSIWWDSNTREQTDLNKNLLHSVGMEIINRIRKAIEYSTIWVSKKHPSNPCPQYFFDWASSNDFDINWLNYFPDKRNLPTQQINDNSADLLQPKREIAVKAWMIGKGLKNGDEISDHTRKELWDKLSDVDDNLFRPSSDATVNGVFNKMSSNNIFKFPKGRKKK